MSAIFTTARRAIQTRPLLSLSATYVTSLTTYAYYIEHDTKTQASKYHNVISLKSKSESKSESKLISSSDTSSSRSNDSNMDSDMDMDMNRYVLPKDYTRDALSTYWNNRPFSVMHRLYTLCNEVIPFVFSYTKDFYIYPKLEQFTKPQPQEQQQSQEQPKQSIEELQTMHAKELRHLLTRLGPAFIKLGQQLSIRPDLLPAHVLFELQRLCDQVKPISDEEAKRVLMDELGDSICIIDDDVHVHVGDNVDGNNNMHDIIRDKVKGKEKRILIKDLKLVASASLGQVYKATRIHTSTKNTLNSSDNDNDIHYEEEQIAIKIQRPEMKEKVSLDLYLLNNYGAFLDYIFDKLTNQIPFHESFINCFANGSYNELDYIKEAYNQKYLKHELAKRGLTSDVVYIPNVFHDMTSEKVITMDWIEGIKLANAPLEDVQQLIPVGVELFLTQLLDIGFFHSDPHPGNLYVIQKPTTNRGGNQMMSNISSSSSSSSNSTSSSSSTTTAAPITKPILCLLDFGLCAEIDPQSRLAMTAAIVHLLNGDYNTLINKDAKELGFLPHDLDIAKTDIQPILTKILKEGLLESKSNLVERKRNLMSISNELNQVFFEYPFSVPPFFALITRGLGLLEGIALSGDPNFDIFQASYPYASKRAAEIYGKHSWSWLKNSWNDVGVILGQGGKWLRLKKRSDEQMNKENINEDGDKSAILMQPMTKR